MLEGQHSFIGLVFDLSKTNYNPPLPCTNRKHHCRNLWNGWYTDRSNEPNYNEITYLPVIIYNNFSLHLKIPKYGEVYHRILNIFGGAKR